MQMKVNSALLREHRNRRGWSQEQLSMVSGLGLRTVHRIENEGAGSYESVMAIAAALSLNVEDLRAEELAASPAQAARLRALELLVRLGLAVASGLLVPLLLHLIIFGGWIDLNSGGFSRYRETQLASIVCGFLFAAFVLLPFVGKTGKSGSRVLLLVFSGALSFYTAINILSVSQEYVFGETIESFLLASVVGAAIVLLAARLWLRLVLPLLSWFIALVVCLFGGAYLYLVIDVLGDYEFLTFAAFTGFCLWHAMLVLLLFNGANRDGSAERKETVLLPLVLWLDEKFGQRIDSLLKHSVTEKDILLRLNCSRACLLAAPNN